MNYAAVDPALTNERCSFWHFRFDADADMKMSALTDTIAANKNIKQVYLINQDYSFGQAVAKAARAMLAQKRPDISIVGDDLHPLGKVKDFAPYVAKIRASGADSVITGNWGNDFTLLVKAARESGLNADYYSYYAGSPGMLTALGDAALGHIKNVHVYAVNPPNERSAKYISGYREKYKEDYIQSQHGVVIEMLAQAIERARSTDPEKVARALEGMTYEYLFGPVQMRADNHQLIQPLFISSVAKVDGKELRFDADRTGMGWKAERRIEGKDTIMPTIVQDGAAAIARSQSRHAPLLVRSDEQLGCDASRAGRTALLLQSVVARFRSSCVAAALVRRMSSASLRLASTPARYSGVMSPVM